MKVYAALGAFLALAHANLDIITLQTRGDTYITEATATLVLGQVPNPITGDVALWSAIMLDGQDFLQGVTSNSANGYCGSSLGKAWCNFAYMLKGSNPTVGKPVKASPGQRVTTHYKLNPSTQMWDQDLSIDGTIVSQVSTSKGQKGKIFYTSIECASGVGSCAPAPAHSWENISIILSKADTSFQHNGNWQYGATGGAMSTPDGGKTWNFTTLNVPTTTINGRRKRFVA